MKQDEQLSLFPNEEKPSECCNACEHFAEFKEHREYINRDGYFTVFGMCCKSFNKNGSYALYPIYIPEGKCKTFQRKKRRKP